MTSFGRTMASLPLLVPLALGCLPLDAGAIQDALGRPASGPSVVELRASVRTSSARVRLADVSVHPLPAAWAKLVVADAPAPGRANEVSRAYLRRRLSAVAPGRMPNFAGAWSVKIARTGRAVPDAELRARIESVLADQPIPEGAHDQRFKTLSVPSLNVGTGQYVLRVVGPLPRIGQGSVRMEIIDQGGRPRPFHAGVRRSLLIDTFELVRAVDPNVDLTEVHVRKARNWIERAGDWADHERFGATFGGWTTRRALEAGRRLRSQDLRPTPLVRRGELVEWIVRRGDLRVSMEAISRGEGGRGDWIYVRGPFGPRSHRVRVLDRGRVTDDPTFMNEQGKHAGRGSSL